MSDNLRKDFLPDPSATATLYYLPQRGRADQVRWLMAATEVSFVQKDVASNDTFKSMQEMLPFGSIPFLQIDGLEIAETQVRAIVHF
jgi:glutathione S-transferase